MTNTKTSLNQLFFIFNAINLFFLIFWADFKWSWEMNCVLTGWERPGQILLEFLQRSRTRRLPIITAYKICAANPELETHFIHFEIQYQHLETQVPLKIWESGVRTIGLLPSFEHLVNKPLSAIYQTLPFVPFFFSKSCSWYGFYLKNENEKFLFYLKYKEKMCGSWFASQFTFPTVKQSLT